MRRITGLLILIVAFTLVNGAGDKTALVLTINDAIGPASSDYIKRGLSKARDNFASLVILQLDTPGGLDTAMRDIIRDIIASPIPVAVYVSPSGARAASAGTYMLYAAHIAAMAPATNLGAATPIQIGGLPDIKPPAMEPDKKKKTDTDKTDKTDEQAPDEQTATETAGDALTKKMVNDAVAYIRSLAEMRHRNADWAEQAVREAASLSAEKALEKGVIDVIADDIPDLLQQINGKVVLVKNEEQTLRTEGLVTEPFMPDWRNRLLAVITNPNIAYILMLLGIYGLFFELANPGYILPGVIGAISIFLALYALQVLPVNYAGLGLIILGIVFMIAELFVPSFGALGFGGVIAFIIGSIILFDKESGNISLSIPLIIAVATLSAGFFLITIRAVFNAHRRPVVSGAEEMVGSIGQVLEDFDTQGMIHIHGETWQVESDMPLHKGDSVRVLQRHGLLLKVEPVEEKAK